MKARYLCRQLVASEYGVVESGRTDHDPNCGAEEVHAGGPCCDAVNELRPGDEALPGKTTAVSSCWDDVSWLSEDFRTLMPLAGGIVWNTTHASIRSEYRLQQLEKIELSVIISYATFYGRRWTTLRVRCINLFYPPSVSVTLLNISKRAITKWCKNGWTFGV